MTVRGRDKFLRDKRDKLAQDKAGKRVTNPRTNARYAVRKQLENLAKSPQAPAAARVTAARTLAEIDGLIGKHQQPPDRLSTSQLHELSRIELVAELERLRALIGLGLMG